MAPMNESPYLAVPRLLTNRDEYAYKLYLQISSKTAVMLSTTGNYDGNRPFGNFIRPVVK